MPLAEVNVRWKRKKRQTKKTNKTIPLRFSIYKLVCSKGIFFVVSKSLKPGNIFNKFDSICMRFVLRQVCFDLVVKRINISTCLTAVIVF